MDKSQIIEVLTQNNYPIRDSGDYISTAGLFRGGLDDTSLAIYWKKNLVIDFVEGERFSIKTLIQRILGLETEAKVDDWIKTKNYNLEIPKEQENLIKMPKIFSENIKDGFVADYSYFEGRGISAETCKVFEGGLKLTGIFKNRQCLIIRNSKGQIVGITGRDTTDKKKAKWFHHGNKSQWVYNGFLSSKIIREKNEVLLVESPLDVMKLWDYDYKNVLCLFGTEISLGIVNFCLKINPRKIIIATNNEESGIGNEAAEKGRKKLLKYFDRYTIDIKLPPTKDFAECTLEQFKLWTTTQN